MLIFTALPLSAAEVVTYYHNDHLGSPIAATDDTGTVVWQQAYGPWGAKLTVNTDERGYTGNWLDEETGLADHKARWYTSSIGRFTGIDPVKWQESNIHSFNRYAYASNNPYAYVDREGRNAVTFVGGVIVESYNSLLGKGFNGDRVLGALADGYNGEGAGFARSLYQDAETFVPIGAVAGALIKGGRLAKAVAQKGGLWSSTKSKSAVENAFGHWSKHKSEFPEFQNAKQYAEGAKDFLTNPPKGTLTKTNSRGDTLRYNPGSNTFGVMSKDGSPKTMFRPKAGMNYWNRQ